ncbi:TetR/AcrR family transcriptional regulator [Nocardia sp. NPDC051990]|uniref:TetR/AcrR family transcriptional regulator n=1 Tax=Nocardia sp. NPDC051990 TaxID=3155285 RepID=UPI00343A8C51
MLLDAASTLFVEKGYQQTTFADIAARSGISRGSIPWHFGNKEGLLAAVVDYASESLFGASTEGDLDHAPLVDDLLSRVKEFSMARVSLLFVTLYVEAVDPASPIHDKYVALHERLRQFTKRWIDTYVQLPGTVTSEGLAIVLVGAAIGIHLQSAMAPDRVDIEHAVDQLSELLKTTLLESGSR